MELNCNKDTYWIRFYDNLEIPELRYQFNGFETHVQVWPHLKTLDINPETGDLQATSRTPDIEFDSLSMGTFTSFVENDSLYSYSKYPDMVAMLEWWKDNRDHFEAEIGKWIAYVPENVRNTFKDWNWMTSIKGRCLQLSAKYEKFYQLCETNPGLAFTLADRKYWDKSHPLSKKRINEVLEEKQSELSVLLGFGSGGWKLLRKLSPELLTPAYIRLFRELVKDPFYLGVFNNSNQIHETGFDFIMKAMTSKYKNLLSASLLLDIFRNYDSRDRENWDIELLFMIDGMNYEYGKESYGTNLFYFWEDCIDYNQERGITTVKSLLRRHDQMVTELNELDEEKVLKENKSLPHLPEIVREITTVGNKHGYKRVKIEQITTSYDLFQAGKRLKNCAFSYLDDGLNGDYFFFL